MINKGSNILDAAEKKFEYLDDKLSSIESDIESKFEYIEEEIKYF